MAKHLGSIPRVVNLPFGYRVRTVLQSHDKFVEDNGDASRAAWQEDTDAFGSVIYLDRSRPIKKLRADYVHEFQHALVDWLNHVLNLPYVDVRH